MHPLILEDGEFRLEQDELGASSWTPYVKTYVTHKDGTKSATWKRSLMGESLFNIMNKIIKIRQKVRDKAPNQDYVQSIKFLLPEQYKEGKLSYYQVMCDYDLRTPDITKELIQLQNDIRRQRI